MPKLMLAILAAAAISAEARQVDYGRLWDAAIPFHVFLDGVRARQDQWRTRFANAAIEADVLTRVRALKGRHLLLAVAEDRCSDSAWAVPYLAKLAAAVPDKLELRVIAPVVARAVQAEHLTPDGRMATPTIAVLDESRRFVGAWVERPAEIQQWYVEHKATMSSDQRYEHLASWYAKDAGRTTIEEVLVILERQ